MPHSMPHSMYGMRNSIIYGMRHGMSSKLMVSILRRSILMKGKPSTVVSSLSVAHRLSQAPWVLH